MDNSRTPYFSVIIPVLHEASVINSCIKDIFSRHSGSSLEIIVVAADTDDRTPAAVKHEHVTTLTAATGRARQMNAGAQAARGRVLVFLHADTRLPDAAFPRMRETVNGSRYVGGAFDLGIDSARPVLKLIALAGSCRSRLTRIPYGDQCIFLNRDYFMRIGGFADIPLMEDVELMRRIKKNGGRIRIIPERVLTSPRRWHQEGILYTTIRNWTLVCLYLLGCRPDRLRRWYRSQGE